MPHLDNDIDDFDEELKSKSELKREMHELQEFAFSLVKMSKHQRSRIPLTETLQEAMVLADKIHGKHDAMRRHVRFIARVLQETDLEPIRAAIDVMANKHQQATAQFTFLENLRDELIAQGNDKIEETLASSPALERQKLRQLVRQASKEISQEKPGKSYRDLFAYLKAHIKQ